MVYNSLRLLWGRIAASRGQPHLPIAAASVAMRDGVMNLSGPISATEARTAFSRSSSSRSGWSADQQIVLHPGTSIATSYPPRRPTDGRLHPGVARQPGWKQRDLLQGVRAGRGLGRRRHPPHGEHRAAARAGGGCRLHEQCVCRLDGLLGNGRATPTSVLQGRKGEPGTSTRPSSGRRSFTTFHQAVPGDPHDGFGSTYITAWTDQRFPASLGKNREAFYKIGSRGPPPGALVVAVGRAAAAQLHRIRSTRARRSISRWIGMR